MKRAEDGSKGLMAVDPDDSGENTLRYGRMKYDGRLRLYRSDCVLNLDEFANWPTKKEAVAAARRLRMPAANVDRIGSRFWSAWGIRHDCRDHYFLAVYS